MAGHLEVNKISQKDLSVKLYRFLDKQPIKNMIPFARYRENGFTFQRLTDRYEDGDKYVMAISPWTFKFDDGEVCEGAIAEIHLSADMTVNKVYMVM